jgi:outer membrane protein OmpA-like peptidoglycan-associated protein
VNPATEAAAAEVLDRADVPRGALNTAWPVVAMALLLLLLLRACVPGPTGTHAPFDAAAAARQANDAALAALRALPARPEVEQALAALNAAVINFDSGSDAVPAATQPLLDEAARVIASLPEGTRIVVTGHTDGVGNPTANLALSERRAAAVRAALQARGVPAVLEAEGVGGSRPLADNGTDNGRFRNRRIEFSAAP